MQEVQKDSLLKRFLLQFTDPLIVVLILAALSRLSWILANGSTV
ncbi:MAG: cation-transporting P-type ATPase [Holdemania massiliensis]